MKNKESKNALVIKFKQTKEKFSLGALLILKQEIDMLLSIYNVKKIKLFYQQELLKDHIEKFKQLFPVLIEYNAIDLDEDNDILWPFKKFAYQNDDSYQSFERILYLNKLIGKKPCLKWGLKQIQEAKSFLSRYLGKIFIVHLKNVAPYNTEESNANLSEWFSFFKKHAIRGKYNFVLIGRDEASKEITQIPGIISANKENISLFSQLAMIPQANGFLGMASGLCQGAILSNTPFVIFKHHKHHPDIMKKELDSSKGFSFCNSNQQIWRKIDSIDNIEKAFKVINNE